MSVSLIVTFAKQNAHSEIFFAITDLAQAFGFMFMMEARSGFLHAPMAAPSSGGDGDQQ